MKCIFCDSETKVIDKRESKEGTRRRRKCLKCGKRFTTYEKADKREIIVIKKDGRREAFSREKVRTGIVKACEKRPVSIEKINNLIDKIEEKLRNKNKEIKTEIIGKMVMNGLKRIDNVAYIRFASVYRNFKDIEDFKKVVKEVKK